MADPLRELEHIASNVAYTLSNSGTRITNTDVERWTRLFDMSPTQAREQIAEHRNVVERKQVSDKQWEMVKAEKVREGYDREAWEFSLQHPTLVRTRPDDSTSLQEKTGGDRMYILKLEGPLSSVEQVQHIAELSRAPQIVAGTDGTSNVLFCEIDKQTRERIIEWLARFHPSFTPAMQEADTSAIH